jgi:hypothetical protein
MDITVNVPTTCDDFPSIDPKTNIPELEVEMIRLKRIYFEPYAIAYAVVEALKQDKNGDMFETLYLQNAKLECTNFGQDATGQFYCESQIRQKLKKQYDDAIKLAEEQRESTLKSYIDYFQYVINKYSKSPITLEYLDSLPSGCSEIVTLTPEQREEALNKYKRK